MTIRTKEADVPSEFPPARLYLDDIEEIVRILVAATQRQDSTGGVSRPKVTFTIKDRVCDEVEELPKIAKKTTELWILVEGPHFGPAASISFNEKGSYVSFYGLEDAERLTLFQKLAPIFKRRNLRVRTFTWSHHSESLGALFAAGLATLSLPVVSMLKHGIHPTRLFVDELLLVSAIITLSATLYYHSIIIMRPSSEPSPLRQELLHKFPLVAISSALTFLLTLLGLYLKHKYWP